MDPLAFLHPEDSRKSYLTSTFASAAAPALRPGLLAGSFSLPSASASDDLSDGAWHSASLSGPQAAQAAPQQAAAQQAAFAKGALQLNGYGSAAPTAARSSGLYNMF